MSLIAIALNLIVSLLLVCAIAYGVRLERRLRAIRDGQLAFGKAVAELNMATERARAGLAELRGATDESTDLLGGRISRAREVADRLERLVSRADAGPQPVAQPLARRDATPPQPHQPHQPPLRGPAAEQPTLAGPEGGLAALLARLKAVEESPGESIPPIAPRAAPRPARTAFDDDLFEDAGAFA